MDSKKILFIVLFYITVIGALNWGLQALNCNAVEKLGNVLVSSENQKTFENVVYYVVALSGLAAGVMYTMHLVKKKDDDN